jgi:hypothetical protein
MAGQMFDFLAHRSRDARRPHFSPLVRFHSVPFEGVSAGQGPKSNGPEQESNTGLFERVFERLSTCD